MLSIHAQQLEAMLIDCEEGEVASMILPFDPSVDRPRSLDRHSRAVAELRGAGWHLNTRVDRADNGEVLSVEVVAAPSGDPA